MNTKKKKVVPALKFRLLTEFTIQAIPTTLTWEQANRHATDEAMVPVKQFISGMITVNELCDAINRIPIPERVKGKVDFNTGLKHR